MGDLQDSYTDALLPLGVTAQFTGTPGRLLKPTYTPFANPEGAEISRTLRKVPGAAGRLAEKEREQTARKGDANRADQDMEQRAAAVQTPAQGGWPIRRRCWRHGSEALTTWRDGALETVRRQMTRLQVLLGQAASHDTAAVPGKTPGAIPLQPDDGADAAQPQDDRPTAGPAP